MFSTTSKISTVVSSSWTVLVDVPTVVYVFDRIAVRVDSNVRGRREGPFARSTFHVRRTLPAEEGVVDFMHSSRASWVTRGRPRHATVH